MFTPEPRTHPLSKSRALPIVGPAVLNAVIFDDQTTATLIFDSYVASIGPGVSVTENRKNY